MDQAALKLREASRYIGMTGNDSEWLLEPGCPVPRCDIRRPGAKKPLWVWRRVDLDKFLEDRLVRPGERSQQER